jgi:hypothetical protein
MRKSIAALAIAALLSGATATAGEEPHHHPVPEKLGAVTFQTSCAAAVKQGFDRGIALLHSFAYDAAEAAFRDVAAHDPHCAMAWWGMSMTHYHQLWEPPSEGDDLATGADEIRSAANLPSGSAREHAFIVALELYYSDAANTAVAVRARRYAGAMADLAKNYPADDEVQIFYALSLIASASPADKTHANQKRAADILEPIWRRQPEHPGLPHYLIHAYDSEELASRGLAAARAYSRIAPSAPHALHMPSHIFTRLGLWDDSIASNLKARAAARAAHDIGEELHAMDYLTYAYLQRGRAEDAAKIVADTRAMSGLPFDRFKVGYAATAMPVRLAVERHDWEAAQRLETLPGTAPQVSAIVYWARALGHARSEVASSADADIAQLQACVDMLNARGDAYWATETLAMLQSAQAWRFAAQDDAKAAVASLRAAAEEEDGLEKLPVTPGPVVPAREQLGELLLRLHQPKDALREFQSALALAPARRGALLGAIAGAEQVGDMKSVEQLRRALAAK